MAPPATDLRSPLLAGPRGAEVIVDVVDAEPERNGTTWPAAGGRGGGGEGGCPYEFLGVSGPPIVRPPSSIDPFRNHTLAMSGAYEWCKMVVLLPVALARLVIFGLALLIGFIATKLALVGWKDRQNPMPQWRCRIMWITRICTRCILFAFGYHWIRRIGRPASREIAPIVVSNHISYVEPIFFFYELFPTIVASESHDSLPFVGTIIRAMQVIYVDRFSASSRKQAVSEIKRKATCNGFPRVLLFPEGTTTNGRVLISFQLGAFIPGIPVQPVVVRYPHVHFDQSWGHIPLAKLMCRMFLQFHNFMEVEYLPIVVPHETKQENAIHFAEQTSYAMASALNVVQTSHSYGDLMLLTRASELKKDKCSNYMVEMAWVESSFNISSSEAMEFLDQFLAMNPDSNGRVTIYGFLSAFGLGLSPLSEKIFGFIDVEKKGSITFRQFLLGSAYIRRQPMFRRECDTSFSKLDDKATGYLSIEQLCDVVQSAAPGTSDEMLCQLMKREGVGAFSKDDFKTCLQKNPLLIALFATSSKMVDSVEAP